MPHTPFSRSPAGNKGGREGGREGSDYGCVDFFGGVLVFGHLPNAAHAVLTVACREGGREGGVSFIQGIYWQSGSSFGSERKGEKQEDRRGEKKKKKIREGGREEGREGIKPSVRTPAIHFPPPQQRDRMTTSTGNLLHLLPYQRFHPTRGWVAELVAMP